MTLLEEIRDKLKNVDPKVYYGLAEKTEPCNYIVFRRNRIKHSANKTGKTHYYSVAVVREDYVEEGIENKIIEEMRKIPGMKVSQEDISYDYAKKPNTNKVVEIMEIPFCKAVKNA